MKCLIIQTAFIGDVVLALPIAQVLKKNFPNAEVHFLVRKGNENLLQNHPDISKIWIWNKKEKLSSGKKLIQFFRNEKLDYVINPHRFTSSGIFTLLSGAKITIGFNKNPLSFAFSYKIPHIIQKGIHEVHRNLSLLKPLLNYEPTLERPILYPSNEDCEKVSFYQKEPYVVLAPASVWFTKQWQLENWVLLAQKLSKNYKVYVVGASSDYELAEKVKNGIPNIENLTGKLTFLQTASLMSKAVRVWVNDSAPLHFASAVNAPVTAIFCSTTPDFGFFPLSDDSIVLSDDSLACKPCGIHGKKACPQKHFLCSKNITVDKALQF